MRRSLKPSRIKSSLAPDWSLDVNEVESRRGQYGPNNIIETHTNLWLELLIDTAKDPMIWFLVATSILFALLNYYNQAIILFLATIPLIGMDAFLHWRTQVSTQGLRSKLATKATVIRNGLEITLPVWQIVPGDLVIIPTGTSFPADGIIIGGENLQVDESALTGESFPAQKQTLTTFPKAVLEPAIESTYWGFAGTRLLTGRALLRVVYTGQETIYGEIVASTLQTSQEHTPLQMAISKLVFLLILIATLFCVVLALVRYFQGFGVIDAILSAATLAVAALPDEFPVVFTFFLGVGVYRLARKKALVRRAVSVENIGRVTCICSDKTGTITEGRFQLAHYFPANSFQDKDLLYLATLASRTESGDPLDLAIYNEANKQQIKVSNRIISFPFTEDRKRETSIAPYNSNHLVAATKGAPETILSISTLSSMEQESLLQQVSNLASSGYKVIACGKYLIDDSTTPSEPKTNYQFAGLLAFEDPPRNGVSNALSLCQESQIHVLMITGDHPETAEAIAREIGLGKGNPKVVNAEDLKNHLQNNDTDYLRTIDVIARAIPSQKVDIVTALQSSGEIVAVTGDGVNDVPALKAGDIGIAMGERGTQSAREVADIVLLDDNFGSIVNAISEGRQLFKNMQCSFKYLLMIHIPFVFSAAIIPLLGYPLLYYPIHIVMIELIIHPTSMLVFQDLPQSTKLEPAIRQVKIHFFSGRDWFKIVSVGIFSLLVVTLSFIFVLHEKMGIEHARAISLTFLSFTSVALVLGLSGFRTWTARIIIITTIIFTILLAQTPIIAKFLYITPLNMIDWSVIVICSLITLALLKI